MNHAQPWLRWYGGIAILVTLAATVWSGEVIALAHALRPAPSLLSAAATPTYLLNYQGRLLDPATGTPKPDGNYNISFRLYNVESGGTALWTESKSVTLSKGLFTTLLGDTVALNLPDFVNQVLWLGITVGGDPEATPRQRIGHTAYAIYAVGSGETMYAFDSDLLDGLDSTAFAPAVHSHSTHTTNDNDVTSANLASGVTPKFISIDPLSVRVNAGTLATGFGPNAGLRLADSGSSQIAFGFTLPPDYTPGHPVTLRLVWHTDAIHCGIFFAPDFISFSRPGRTHLSQASASAGLKAVGGDVLSASGVTNSSEAQEYLIESPEAGTTLQPGDSILLGLYRSATHSSDTCAADLVIQGIQIIYE